MVPLAFAVLVFALLAYLLVASKGSTPVILGLLIAFVLLALRASGLKRAEGEADATGHVRFHTEFEGPTDDDA